ncbi:hypothetical protein ABES20_12250, partial [Geobacillus stearothermophilus]|uniref:hypothetical protein n=1 Tax=Geobacillus stearothermophilus TaxID=1422 RepID=UPI003D21C867
GRVRNVSRKVSSLFLCPFLACFRNRERREKRLISAIMRTQKQLVPIRLEKIERFPFNDLNVFF